MKKLEQLIAQVSSYPVPFIELGTVASVKTGDQLNKESLTSWGKYPVVNGGIAPSGYHHEFNTSGPVIVISQGGASAGYVNWMPGAIWAGAHCFTIKPNEQMIDNRYLFHFLKYSEQKIQSLKSGAGIPGLNRSKLIQFKCPVPSLEIQHQVVKILDTFTNLDAELGAELEARKTQYEFYRESLFDSHVSTQKSLDSVASIWRGRRFVKDDIRSEGVPAIHYGEIYTKYGLAATEAYSFLDSELASKLRFVSPGDVVLVSAGETIEDIGKSFTWLGEGDAVIHDACYGIRSSEIDPRYMVHFFNTHNFRSQLRKYISSSKISAISTEKLGKVFIPVPSLGDQKIIADVLDSFDCLVSDISIGLPAEIDARRIQYQYYRNQLLAFKALEVA